MIKKVKKGFTLIELVVVIAVIAILSAVSVVAYVGITNSAKKSVAEQEASTVKTLLRTELTRGNYSYEFDTSKKIIFSFADEKVEYALEGGAAAEDLTNGLDELLCVAQGKEKSEKDADSYIVSGTPTDNQFLVEAKNSKLVLVHSNGKEANIFAFGEKASA